MSGQETWCPTPPGLLIPLRWLRTRRAICMSPEEYRNARVHRLAPDGHLKLSWGEPGETAPNQFHLPHSLLVHEGARLCV